eukprot:CAMPEP_0171626316 /NCGR_PEP_ID=MMETSP0990-20121206/19956_1 /TAXON_ID=483369 /ORGANISM="non described non described, Strain CCMP2098" /LENGTH=32 /DNA_ID= /DNA_START= /DNA_END= /DNA_ORIENTATION=
MAAPWQQRGQHSAVPVAWRVRLEECPYKEAEE